ncbi:Uncharacterised protein [Mycobacterium tuberculosis]|nr:Uncharacterised protein [Mycobacterium tuberculosis]CKQ08006.1 Uncharacterised protein [Mycobacterium tuberculosis]CKV73085.1 Uncharacterised protein [Mycobacterium tuberculosis]COX01908.1 Uncharacterised protein [Mycobacterium tuberculosis]
MKSRFSAWIAGLFHCVMEPLKIFANVGPSKFSEETLLRL